jgi:hypothetical protein
MNTVEFSKSNSIKTRLVYEADELDAAAKRRGD